MQIKEISKKLNITSRTIRYYEKRGLIKIQRLNNNYRYFDNKSIERLTFLVRSRNLGFSLEESKELIKLFENTNRRSKNVRDIARKKLENLNSQIIAMTELKESLERLVKQCPGNEKPDCPIIDVLSK